MKIASTETDGQCNAREHSLTPAATTIRQRNQHLILKAASEEFSATGFDATQTRDIAERAGIPKANIYYYFQSKENLYAQVLLGFVEPLLKASAALRESDDPVVGLQAYIHARIRIIQQNPHSSKVFSHELLFGGKHLPEECKNLLQAEAQRNVDCLRSWIDRGVLAPAVPEHLMLFIWSATRTYTNLGWQMSLITGTQKPDDADYKCAAATITQMVLSGVVPKVKKEIKHLAFTT
ncbi:MULTISPECIES: TetR/AcrR family transcriptional regulator [Pseudomonas]|uniref:HTH-type transcriptional regulator RutR n=2 Tax=Pseudomonas fluorescens group TaxID=136843 RepID=A0A5E7UFX5_PSEFL|nr:TetR/AcrR family transcriptional regulator [Pseudomonas fluorescens]VVQ10377.1 HTH-type transcriptional regulator RutR [Pseudomonas fluorescens]